MRHLVFFFLLLHAVSFAQIKDHIVYKQEVMPAYQLAIDSGQFTKGIELLDRAEKKYEQLYAEEYMLMAYCYKKLGDNQKAAGHLKTCWSVPSYDFSLIMNSNELNGGTISETFTKDQQKLVGEGFKKYDELKPPFVDSLQYWAVEMKLRDYEARNRPLPPGQGNYEEIKQVDELNRELLVMYMNMLGGYPGEGQMQLFAMEFYEVLLHTAEDEAFFQKMKPVFLEEVRKGNMPPSFYAAWVDHHQYDKNLPTMYDTKPKVRKQYSKAELKAIRKNRFEIGLIDVDSFFEVSKLVTGE